MGRIVLWYYRIENDKAIEFRVQRDPQYEAEHNGDEPLGEQGPDQQRQGHKARQESQADRRCQFHGGSTSPIQNKN